MDGQWLGLGKIPERQVALSVGITLCFVVFCTHIL